MDGLRLHGARRSYAKQLREFLKEDMALSTAQARTLEARAEALGLSAGDVNAIEKRISRRAMIRARTRLHWQRVIQGLTDAMRALRAWTEPVYRFRAERAAARRKKRGSSAHKASMMTRFSVHVSGDIGAVLEDVLDASCRLLGASSGLRVPPHVLQDVPQFLCKHIGTRRNH